MFIFGLVIALVRLFLEGFQSFFCWLLYFVIYLVKLRLAWWNVMYCVWKHDATYVLFHLIILTIFDLILVSCFAVIDIFLTLIGHNLTFRFARNRYFIIIRSTTWIPLLSQIGLLTLRIFFNIFLSKLVKIFRPGKIFVF